MPEGLAFAEAAARAGALSDDDMTWILHDQRTRSRFVWWGLTDATAPQNVIESVESGIMPVDWNTLEVVCIQNRLDDDRLERLFSSLPSRMAGVLAAAAFRREHADKDWPSAQLRPSWLRALRHFRASNLPYEDDYDIELLFKWLASNEPVVMTDLVIATLDEAADDGAYSALTHSSWDTLRLLPTAQRVRLWRHFGDRRSLRGLLNVNLFNRDVRNLEELLGDGTVIVTDVLEACKEIESNAELLQVAHVLVPKGVDPLEIAVLVSREAGPANFRSDTESCADRFKNLAKHHRDDEIAQQVAQAGIAYFSAQLKQELNRKSMK